MCVTCKYKGFDTCYSTTYVTDNQQCHTLAQLIGLT